MQIKQSLALITGAASGMGLACAEKLQALGAECVLLDTNADKLKTEAARLSAHAFALDVSDAEAAAAIFAQIKSLGALRIAINCAGIAPAGRMVGRDGPLPLADFEQVIRVNLVGTFNIMRLAAELMLQTEISADGESRGVIINTSSIAAFEGQIGQTAYAAAKGGVAALTLPAARELASQGIRVNCIAPGLVETPLLTAMPEQVQASLAASVPMPARLAKAAEFAALAQHIIENNMINGATYRLDGALRMAPK